MEADERSLLLVANFPQQQDSWRSVVTVLLVISPSTCYNYKARPTVLPLQHLSGNSFLKLIATIFRTSRASGTQTSYRDSKRPHRVSTTSPHYRPLRTSTAYLEVHQVTVALKRYSRTTTGTQSTAPLSLQGRYLLSQVTYSKPLSSLLLHTQDETIHPPTRLQDA